jgi:heterotetrameric sarcosine oxidase alpha subunit
MKGMSERKGLRLGDGMLTFRFDGRYYEARVGDTASAALLANGVRLMGRSVKARRRRGVLTAGPEEPNALVTVGERAACIPNIPASQLVLTPGLTLRSQNRWPTLSFDLASALQAGGGFFSAGFYYKTFIWPSWHAYERLIRALAGLGYAPQASDLPLPSVEHLHCDVLIAGGGVAGLTAARAAARAGARVVLCEREPSLGGELEFEGAVLENLPAIEWVKRVAAELEARHVRILRDTAVVGGRGGEVIAHAEPGGLPGTGTLYHIRARSFLCAMGATERPLAFIDNDLPGVMLLGAAERYLARYGVRVGRRVLICANHNRAYAAAERLLAGGIEVAAIVDCRPERTLALEAGLTELRGMLQARGVECVTESVVLAARGARQVSGALLAPVSATHTTRVIPCDTLLMSGGWTPNTHALQQEGGTRRYVPGIAAFVADAQPPGRTAIGAANGVFEITAICAEAQTAGEHAAARSGSSEVAPAARGDPPPNLAPFWRAPASRASEKRQFVDFQNDVTVADLRVAVEEGFSQIEHAKRYTALGFGTDQGRLAGVLGAAVLAELKGERLDRVGTSRLRQPYHPVTMKSLAGLRAGSRLRVIRRTPLHDWHQAHAGVLEPSGLWMRTRHYGGAGADVAAVAQREAQEVRASGGFADASTLGKIEIQGKDAAAFLDYVYLTRASSLKAGRSRYAVNLREDGMVLDDGLLLRMGEEHFRATTSTGHAAEMLSHFEFFRASEFAQAAVALTDVSDAWAVIAVAGPKSRDALLGVLDAALHEKVQALSHMDFTTGLFAGKELLVLRASFSGELAYELHCRPEAAVPLAEALLSAGMKPYGLEALDILRVEKGYLTHSELSGQTTPYDLGMQGFMSRKDRFVGRDLLDRPAFHDEARPRLIGVRSADGRAGFLGGAQLVTAEARNRPVGYITSSAFSPTLGEWVGLALVARSLGEGSELIAADPVRNAESRVRLTGIVHFDPDGSRMRQ